MKKTWKQNISEIKSLANKLPKTLNESLALEGMMGEGEPMPEEMPQEDGPQFEPGAEEPEVPEQEPAEEAGDSLNVEEFVDDIRKKSLRGMASLAENPDDERYQLLKKIWQICDKKPEQQTAFNNPNQGMQRKF